MSNQGHYQPNNIHAQNWNQSMYRSQQYQPTPQQQQQRADAWTAQQRYQQRINNGARYNTVSPASTLTSPISMQSGDNTPGQWIPPASATQAGYSATVVQPSSIPVSRPTRATTPQTSSANSSPNIPTQQAQQFLDIYMRNNKRLAALTQEMRSEATFGPACDEFREWLSDRRAYHPSNEAALMNCASVVYQNKAMGLWSALCIFELINKFRQYLTESSRSAAARMYTDIHLAATGRPVPLSPVSSSPSTISASSPIQSSPQSRTHIQQQQQPVASSSAMVSSEYQQQLLLRQTLYQAVLQQQQQHQQQQQQQQQIPTRQQPLVQLPIQVPTQQYHHPPLQPATIQQQINQQTLPIQLYPSHNQNVAQQQQPQQQPPQPQPQQLPQQPQQSNIQLPQQVMQQQVPQPEISAVQLIQGSGMVNPYKYIRRVTDAISPFRLQHQKVYTVTPFFVGAETFQRLWTGTPPPDDIKQPLSFVLTSWRDGTPQSRCEWPDKIGVTINGITPAISRRQKVRSQDAYHYRGKDRPVELGSYMVEGKNVLQIHQPECACSHWFAIIIFARETEAMLKQMIMKKRLAVDVGRNIINTLLGKNRADSDDDDIQVMQRVVRIKLSCPVSMKRIEVPVKGEKCKHPDCFDMVSYLAITSENPNWKCPLCNEFIPPTTITRDGFMEKLLNDLDDDVELVEFEEDCDHYKVIRNGEGTDEVDVADKPDATVVCENSNSRPPISAKAEPDAEPSNVISLISDDEDEEPQQPEPTQAANENITNKRTTTDMPPSTNDPKRPRHDNNDDSTPNRDSNFVPDDVLEEILAFTNGSF